MSEQLGHPELFAQQREQGNCTDDDERGPDQKPVEPSLIVRRYQGRIDPRGQFLATVCTPISVRSGT